MVRYTFQQFQASQTPNPPKTDTVHVKRLPVITLGRVLRLRIEETASIDGGQLRGYGIRSRGQPTRGDPQICGLGEDVRITYRQKCHVVKCLPKLQICKDPLE